MEVRRFIVFELFVVVRFVRVCMEFETFGNNVIWDCQGYNCVIYLEGRFSNIEYYDFLISKEDEI